MRTPSLRRRVVLGVVAVLALLLLVVGAGVDLALGAVLRAEQRQRLESVAGLATELTGLSERAGDRVGTLSGGNQQRVNIAVGLMAGPSVLLLDEPSVGLDPAQRERLWGFILGLVGEGTAVAFSTHDIHEAERYAERILVVAEGERIFNGTADELRREVEAGGTDTRDLETSFLAFLRERGH